MTLTDRAMMVRHYAAMKLVGQVSVPERYDMLALVLSPPPELLRASLAQARVELAAELVAVAV